MKVFENGEETTRADADGLDHSVEVVGSVCEIERGYQRGCRARRSQS